MTTPHSPATPPAPTSPGLGPLWFPTSAHLAVCATVAALAGAGALSGCGGGGGTNATALIRAVDASTNGGQVSVYVNGADYTGAQNFFGNSFHLDLPRRTDAFTLGAQSGAA